MIEQRKANLEKSKADLEEARADLWEKQREANRAERLVSKKMVTQEDFEKASSAQKMCTARVASLEAMIKVMQANIKEMEYTLKYQMHIMAPFDGTVVEKQGEDGEVITPMAMSSSLGRSAVVTIADLRNMDVETDISENLMSRIAARPAGRGLRQRDPEQAVQGRAPPDHPHGRPHPGDREGEGRDPRPRRQALPRAGRDRPLPALQDRRRTPMPASPTCSSPSRPCSRRTATISSGSSDKKSHLGKRPVEVATTKDDLARVESGLESGESVVLNPTKALKDNEDVRIAE